MQPQTPSFILLCVAAAVLASVSFSSSKKESQVVNWPKTFEDRMLEQLTLTERELRFNQGFPGEISRFTDGSREIVIRYVTHQTRRLHPAADCFKGSGYDVDPQPLRLDQSGETWGCFNAVRSGERLRVCERIYDEQQNSWSDTSAWFWAALLEQTEGPWWAVTVAEELM